MKFRTRFAPSPTGPLHLGHAYSALLAHDKARAEDGTFLLRIEDIDTTRSRPEWEDRIYADLTWLGITWDEPPMRQTDRLPTYMTALKALWDNGVLYPCTCTRRDIAEAASAPQEGAERKIGPDGPVYPGTCRPSAPPTGPMPEGVALRLDMARALAGRPVFGYLETGVNPGPKHVSAEHLISNVGDIVLSRKDFPGSYHLSAVLDDAAQDITHVVRGEDLFDATQIDVVLQGLLGLPTPRYHHHALIRDKNGKRLAKRDDARAISLYRAEGLSPDDIRAMTGL